MLSAIVIAVAVIVYTVYVRYLQTTPSSKYLAEDEHFKYGSIGAEINGYPYELWLTLPIIFADIIPNGYAEFGFVSEPDKPLPVGVSVVKFDVERVGFNCATCHSSIVEYPDERRSIVLGAPATALDLQAYTRFLADSAADSRFTADAVFTALAELDRPMDWLDRLVYYFVIIPRTKDTLAKRSAATAWLDQLPDQGPGRTDAGNPWKMTFDLNPDIDPLVGAVDMPSLWNQRLRDGNWNHWDGNNNSLRERNLSAALAGGATQESLDHHSIERVAAWFLDLPAPKFPGRIDDGLAMAGGELYAQYCASCHSQGGASFGDVTPIDQVNTDPDRLALFDEAILDKFATVGAGYDWQFTHYRRSVGYANQPLDGIWARAPYLHNGSIPTLADLLNTAQNRPATFRRGCSRVDTDKVGFKCESGFVLDTALQGNGNVGHEYGTHLPAADKQALLEFLKTL